MNTREITNSGDTSESDIRNVVLEACEDPSRPHTQPSATFIGKHYKVSHIHHIIYDPAPCLHTITHISNANTKI
jgi:hypothetical protein